MRPTSSTRSSLMVTSLVARQVGTRTENVREPVSSTPNSSDSRIARTSLGGTARPQLAIEPVERQFDRRRLGDRPVGIRHAADKPDAGRNFLQQLQCAPQPAQSIHRILRFFEAHGSVGAELQSRRCLANAGCVEARAFEHDARGRLRNGAVRAADHSGERDRALGIGDHQVRRIEFVGFAVQRRDFFARTCAVRTMIWPP